VADREAGSFRLVATLAAAGLFSGLVLVTVYLATAPRIERNRAEALRAAIFRVLPGIEGLTAFELHDGQLEPSDAGTAVPDDVKAVFAGFDAAGQLVGWAIPAKGPGFMDTIELLYGFDPRQRTVIGMEVLESRETPGLGDKIVRDADFHENFEELAVEPTIEAVKKGQKTSANEVDCITGATISSEAVVSILNRSTTRWLPLLPTEAVPRPETTDRSSTQARAAGGGGR
jgi:electron transport complex protein RnfG